MKEMCPEWWWEGQKEAQSGGMIAQTWEREWEQESTADWPWDVDTLYFSFLSYFRALLWEPKSIRLAALNTEQQTFLKNRGNFWGQQVKNEWLWGHKAVSGRNLIALMVGRQRTEPRVVAAPAEAFHRHRKQAASLKLPYRGDFKWLL